MFWLTYRQHRAQVLVTVGIVLAFGVALLVQGIGTNDVKVGLSGDQLEDVLSERFELFYAVISWLPGAPMLIGLFWGAPLVAREIERGTLMLTWTQSVTRRRWLAVKLACLGTLVTLCGLALGAMIGAWLTTFSGTRYAGHMADTAIFMSTGVVAGAWWLFGFMLGTASGAVFRKLLPAMVVTLAVFFVVLYGVIDIREDYATPERIEHSLADEIFAPIPADDALITGGAMITPDGREVEDGPLPGCENVASTSIMSCLKEKHYRMVSFVHPADRYWRFQWTEVAILAAGAALLGGVTYHRVSRRSV